MTTENKISSSRVVLSLIIFCVMFGSIRSSNHKHLAQFETVRVLKQVAKFQKIAVLTFDDGPNEPYTSRLLDILKAEKVKATFFVIGKNVERLPHVARRIVREGHVIANHSYSHLRFTDELGPEEIIREIKRGEKAIISATGVKPYLFRFPFGATTPSLTKIVMQQGYSVIGWSSHGYDWLRPRSSQTIANDVLKHISPGTIILLHDGEGVDQGVNTLPTLEATRIILHELKKRDYITKTFPYNPN